MRHILGFGLIATMLVTAGCGGESAAAQCDKLFAHMATVGGKLDPASAKYKTRKAEFAPKCTKMFNKKTRTCLLAIKKIKEAAACMTHLDNAAASGKAFSRYMSKSKTSEARQFVKKMYDGARMYYMDASSSRHSIRPLPPQFPSPSQGPTPPLGSCCKQGGKCKPDASQWTSPVWTALQFSIDDPHYYSYSYIVKGNAYTVRANGDLDCDGKYSTFELRGVIDKKYSDGPAGSATMTRVDELE